MIKTYMKKNTYGPTEILINILSFCYTKLFWPKARIVRPFARIRGKKSLSYLKGLTLGYSCRINAGDGVKKHLCIGNNVVIGDYVHIEANNYIQIGNNTLIASKVFITDTLHGDYSSIQQSSPITSPKERALSFKTVIIGDNCWIGESVAILPGVTLGNGCVCGANAVITKSFSENVIVAGNPAHIIKKWDKSSQTWKSCC